jgi:hypothetical protein
LSCGCPALLQLVVQATFFQPLLCCIFFLFFFSWYVSVGFLLCLPRTPYSFSLPSCLAFPLSCRKCV